MPAVVSKTINSSTPYTWASARFAWSDATRTFKPWAEAAIIDAILRVDEDVLVMSTPARDVTKQVVESFGIADQLVRHATINILRDLNIAESYVDNIAFVLRVTEAFRIGDALANNSEKAFRETVNVIEQPFAKQLTLNVKEALALTETLGRVANYFLKINEGVAVNDALAKSIKLSKNEAFSIFEQYLRRGNAVISDMILSTFDLDMNTFQNVVDSGHAPGFANFKDFIPGDYEYNKAIFRVVLESMNSDRARLKEMTVAVDVPDVIDRGSATIVDPNTGVWVSFNRLFHVAPEVTMNHKGGTTVAIPKVLGDVTVDGYWAILQDPATGNRVIGMLTWTAHGY